MLKCEPITEIKARADKVLLKSGGELVGHRFRVEK